MSHKQKCALAHIPFIASICILVLFYHSVPSWIAVIAWPLSYIFGWLMCKIWNQGGGNAEQPTDRSPIERQLERQRNGLIHTLESTLDYLTGGTHPAEIIVWLQNQIRKWSNGYDPAPEAQEIPYPGPITKDPNHISELEKPNSS